jgi:hypothetical protein
MPAANFRVDRDQSVRRQADYEVSPGSLHGSREFFMPEQAKGTVGSPEQIELVEVAATDDGAEPHHGNGIATAVTVAAVGIGAVALEAALLPGVLLGVAAMWLPHDLRQAFAPLARSTARGYRIGEKTKELIADVREEIEDIVAEVDAENARA